MGSFDVGSTVFKLESIRALASDALYRYCNAILKNCNAIFDFQITLFSISNNAIFDFKKRDFPFLMTQFLLCHKYTLF